MIKQAGTRILQSPYPGGLPAQGMRFRNRASHMCHTINLGNVNFLTLHSLVCIPAVFYLLLLLYASFHLQQRCDVRLVAVAIFCCERGRKLRHAGSEKQNKIHTHTHTSRRLKLIIIILLWFIATVSFNMPPIVIKELITGCSGLVMFSNGSN